MPMIKLTKKYKKSALAFFKKNPTLINRYEKTLIMLEADPSHPSLRLHKLHGNLKDHHSISINLKYRIMLHMIIRDNEIILIYSGSHDYLYRLTLYKGHPTLDFSPSFLVLKSELH